MKHSYTDDEIIKIMRRFDHDEILAVFIFATGNAPYAQTEAERRKIVFAAGHKYRLARPKVFSAAQKRESQIWLMENGFQLEISRESYARYERDKKRGKI